MRRPQTIPGLALTAIVAAGFLHFRPRTQDIPRAEVNDNLTPAGRLANGVLEIDFVAAPARWYPEADDGPSLDVFAFAEEGKPPRIPGPLIRVPAGTRIRARIRNALPDSTPLTLYGFHTRPGSPNDTLHLAPGTTREVRFTAGEPGTYFYAGITSGIALGADVPNARSDDSQLHGAFIVDPAGTVEPPRDRVFVMGHWGVLADSTGPPPIVPIDVMTINGKSWPHTERFDLAVGDTIRWRWVNPTTFSHPMHLHGFYFQVQSRGTWAADTVYARGEDRQAVTELMLSGGTMSMEWVPQEPGNWLFHCHFGFHVSHYLSVEKVPDAEDPLGPDATDHAASGMRGLVLGITVQPGRSAERRPEVYGPPARQIRLLVQAAPRRYGEHEGLGYVIHEGGPAPPRDSVPILSPALVLRRGEPVNITVVNHLRAPTGVHWHGMELPSYPDGVPGWSGTPGRLAPMIAPGDSFVAAFTPPRTGTFIYHSHSNEWAQIASGLYAPLIVVDPDQPYDPERERAFVVGGNGPLDFDQGRVNGLLEPDTVELIEGRTYRLRLIHINPTWRVWMSLRDGSGELLSWRAIAKDGANLPPSQAVRSPALLLAGPGETADFEFTPDTSGSLVFEATTEGNKWTVRVPIRVRRSRPSLQEVP